MHSEKSDHEGDGTADANLPIDVKRTSTGSRVVVNSIKQEPLDRDNAVSLSSREVCRESEDFDVKSVKEIGNDALGVKEEFVNRDVSGKVKWRFDREVVVKEEADESGAGLEKAGGELGIGGFAWRVEECNERVELGKSKVVESGGSVKVDLDVKREPIECGINSGTEKGGVVVKEEEKCGFDFDRFNQGMGEIVGKAKLENQNKKSCEGLESKAEDREPDLDGGIKEEKEDCGYGVKKIEKNEKVDGNKPVIVKPEMQKLHGDEVEIIEEGFGDWDGVVNVKKDVSSGLKKYVKVNEKVVPLPPSTYAIFRKRNNTNGVKEEVDPRVSGVVVDTEDFPDEPGWYLVGGKVVAGVSTAKGKYKVVDNEIVDLNFPTKCHKQNSQWIVRFSTARSGELGRLSIDLGKIMVPLVLSGKVKVRGRCVAAPANLSLLQEIILFVSFYIHNSVFFNIKKTSWRLDIKYDIDSTIYPLLNLFKMLEIRPFQKAEFTPEDIDLRKRSLDTDAESNEPLVAMPPLKRMKSCSQLASENKDEQAISQSSLNKIVGAVELYDLEEMEPPCTLVSTLKPYQKQALYWMTALEKGVDIEKGGETLHPCWAAYRICDQRASSIYVNIFSGEATTKFPSAIESARGGILADAMGLGKTVMTIALILASPGYGNPDLKYGDTPSRVKGGTLIICPMALLGQWKDELDNHSEPESISVFVHYGGDRTNDPSVMACHNVVLTTYGVLAAAYKNKGEDSIYHRVDWYRIVLDEAHTIKSWKTQSARATFTLSAHCRWCLTGTPLQNNLEDLYSLLCFLHVEPWCNWEWWNKFIQRPYNNGDPKGLKMVKAILKPLMLRRTKESKDKYGRPILVLPPTQSQIVKCEQSEAEHDFYNALFRRSKVKFDQFVAQGKVLHNYANILELLLRLRQCCNHPFLVMSREDSQEFSDLNKLARRFLEVNSDSASQGQAAPTPAYVEEVIEGIRQGENNECPICMEFSDDPILTPCAHKMCRECLLSSWRSPACGICPICRQVVHKSDLITCPSGNRFRIDVEKNWTASSKISELLQCLENISVSGSGEKSIVFSQWTCFLDLLEIPLRRKGFGFLRFDGSLSQKQRERVLKEFSETREKMVLLMSLKAGGVGLNLTAASNVYIMDPWWNPAVEEQAIMRIHRIGQMRTVCIRRFIVKGTVEERMLQVQEKKQRMIAGALTDDDVRSARIEELKMLFR